MIIVLVSIIFLSRHLKSDWFMKFKEALVFSFQKSSLLFPVEVEVAREVCTLDLNLRQY